MLTLTDNFGRSIHDLRISITDRCNYKCVYCRTGTNGAAYAELPFEDYLRMARILVGLGITKIRLTGGEPLLRKGIVEFVRELAKLRTVHDKKPEIAITTNGHLLAEIAQPLKDAGLDRVTVSMDAVDPVRFARITRVPNGYESVLAGVRASRQAGLDPVKINCVLLRGFNEDQIVNFGKFARDERVVVRFIEFMPLEEDRVWTPELWLHSMKFSRAWRSICRWRRLRTSAAKRRGDIASLMVWVRLESSHRCRIRSVDIAAGFVSPRMASCVRAYFPCGITTCMN
jgi:cyclic pyranopterin phosphate synthase